MTRNESKELLSFLDYLLFPLCTSPTRKLYNSPPNSVTIHLCQLSTFTPYLFNT